MAGDVGGGTECRARGSRHGLLTHDDGCSEPFQAVHVGAGWGLHEALHEAGIGFVDEPLRFSRNGIEDQRGLAGTRHTREDSELALRDAHVHVLEVVFAGAGDGDEFLFHGSAVY